MATSSIDEFPMLKDLPPGDRNVFYIERPMNGERVLLKWILGIASAVLVSAIVGAFTLNGQLAEARADIKNLKEELADLRRIVEPLIYRRPDGHAP